jgi:hypothetical protein
LTPGFACHFLLLADFKNLCFKNLLTDFKNNVKVEIEIQQ